MCLKSIFVFKGLMLNICGNDIVGGNNNPASVRNVGSGHEPMKVLCCGCRKMCTVTGSQTRVVILPYLK